MRAHMHRYSDEQVAEVCHFAITGLQEVHAREPGGETPTPSGLWAELDRDLRTVAVSGVRQARNGAIPSPREHHNWWVHTLRSMGWRRGPKNPQAKTHPNLTDWSKLTAEQQDKDRLFLAVVTTLTVDLGTGDGPGDTEAGSHGGRDGRGPQSPRAIEEPADRSRPDECYGDRLQRRLGRGRRVLPRDRIGTRPG